VLNFVASRLILRGAGTLVAAGAMLALLSAPSRAQLLFTFSPETQSVAPGGTVTYQGTFTNTTNAALFIGASSSTFLNGNFGDVDVNTTPFFDNLSTVAANSSVTGNIFTATAAADAPAMSYAGEFDVAYGTDSGNPFGSNATGTFNVVVTPAPAALPVFAVGGVLGLVATRRKKKNAPDAA